MKSAAELRSTDGIQISMWSYAFPRNLSFENSLFDSLQARLIRLIELCNRKFTCMEKGEILKCRISPCMVMVGSRKAGLADFVRNITQEIKDQSHESIHRSFDSAFPRAGSVCSSCCGYPVWSDCRISKERLFNCLADTEQVGWSGQCCGAKNTGRHVCQW